LTICAIVPAVQYFDGSTMEEASSIEMGLVLNERLEKVWSEAVLDLAPPVEGTWVLTGPSLSELLPACPLPYK
jgi:hypothetical protein